MLSAGDKAADWSKDDEDLKKERKAYWMSGWATGPDTIMGVFWTAGLLAAASSDASCYAFDGHSSGADGQKCTPTGDWNTTLFESVGGASCLQADVFGTNNYRHLTDVPECMSAFAAYRDAVAYTCNCSGTNAGHAYLGSANGVRPSLVFNYQAIASTFTLAILTVVFGTYVDFSARRKFMWTVLTALCAICTFGMCVLGSNYLWVVGLVFSFFTVLFSELVIPIRGSYLNIVAFDDATRGYVSALRQFAAYVSQLIYALALGFLPLSAVLGSTVQAAVAGTWFIIFMPLILMRFREHPANRKNEANKPMVVLAFSELCAELRSLRQYPEALKMLVVNALANVGGPIIITLITPFATQHLEMEGIMFRVIGGAVLLFGVPFALVLSKLLKEDRLRWKSAWLIVLTIFVLISGVAPAVCTGPNITSQILIIILGGVFGSIGLSWFYSIGWASFVSLTPESRAGAYGGINQFVSVVVQPISPAIYNAVVQSTNNHRIGLATLVPWNVASIILILFVDFEKGKREAGRADAAVPAPVSTTTAA